MNISQEKEHIYMLMRSLLEERRDITKMYYSLKEQLDTLTELETRGLTELDMKGFIDLHNESNLNVMKHNIERESLNTIRKIEHEVSKLKEIETSPKIPLREIEETKEKEVKRNKSSNKASIDDISGRIAHILKESGIPLSAKRIFDTINESFNGEIKYNNFRNNMLPRTLQRNKNVVRASHGYYQYKYD